LLGELGELGELGAFGALSKVMSDRDKKIADSGWGVKPDDQPANRRDVAHHAPPSYRYDPAEPDVIRTILRAQRRGFNTANGVRIEPGRRTVIIDINKDEFVVEGLGYGDPNLIELLKHLGASFDPVELAKLSRDEPATREFALSRAWAWGAERTG
jgi:hypothetical protein